jgi:hypothetical protein
MADLEAVGAGSAGELVAISTRKDRGQSPLPQKAGSSHSPFTIHYSLLFE